MQSDASVPHQSLVPTGWCAEGCEHTVVQHCFIFLDVLVIKAIPRDDSGGSLCQADICVQKRQGCLFSCCGGLQVHSPSLTTDCTESSKTIWFPEPCHEWLSEQLHWQPQNSYNSKKQRGTSYLEPLQELKLISFSFTSSQSCPKLTNIHCFPVTDAGHGGSGRDRGQG